MTDYSDDPLAPARGVVYGFAMSLVLAGVIALVWWLA